MRAAMALNESYHVNTSGVWPEALPNLSMRVAMALNESYHMNNSCHTSLRSPNVSMRAALALNKSCQTYEWVVSHVWMSNVTRMNESCHTYEWVMSHIWMSNVTRMNESCHTNLRSPNLSMRAALAFRCAGFFLSDLFSQTQALYSTYKTKQLTFENGYTPIFLEFFV